MKKNLLIVTAVFLLFALAGCSFGKVYDAKAADFSSNGMTITLTEAFKEKEYEGYTVCYDSSEVAVFVLKESFSLQAGLEALSLDEYAALVYQSNASKSPGNISNADGLTYMEYQFENENENQTYSYYCVMYKGSDAFWLVQFACVESLYEEYKPYFVEWAKTVNVSSET